MEASNIKSLYIIVNAGFSEEVVEIARAEGARGATILNARGKSSSQENFMGISIDAEKEIILCLVDGEIAEKIMVAVKEKAGYDSPAHSVCFSMPVEKVLGINKINELLPSDE